MSTPILDRVAALRQKRADPPADPPSTNSNDILSALNSISKKLDDLIEVAKLGAFALPLSSKWSYQVFASSTVMTINPGQEFTLVDDTKLLPRTLMGNLMSVAVGLSSGDALISINYYLQNRAISVSNSLANFLAGGFNLAVPSSLVVENTPTNTPPWAARLLNGVLVPFSRPFNIQLKNPSASPIVLYAYEIELILLTP